MKPETILVSMISCGISTNSGLSVVKFITHITAKESFEDNEAGLGRFIEAPSKHEGQHKRTHIGACLKAKHAGARRLA